MATVFMDGNLALAYGAVKAGCTFFAGYPITPATSLLHHMLKLLPPKGGICIQGEDEIASMGYCIGASMAGKKVMTATSGPGISLYSEQISFAIGSEIPMVIVDVQRLGPSTGSATRGADSDIQFLRWGNTGGVPVIVLAPSDALECYTFAMHAFNLAEKFRTPVFIASNKEIGMTKESIDLDLADLPHSVDRKKFSGKSYLPYQAKQNKAPDFLPVGGKTIVRMTSSTHGPDGFITVDPDTIQALQERLKNKIEQYDQEICFCDEHLNPDADTLIISYGITSRAVEEAVDQLGKKGIPVSRLSVKTLWPVPEKMIFSAAHSHQKIIVIEMNTGQYVREIQRLLPDQKIIFYGQMDGTLITPAQIMETVKNG